MGEIITQVHLKEDEELVQYKKRRGIKPSFYMIGDGHMNKHTIQSIDLLDVAMDSNKAEQLVIRTIKNKLDYLTVNGEVYISSSKEFTDTEARMFRKGFKGLKDKDLVRRTKLSHYMINPNALVPADYEAALKLWDSVKK